MRRTVVGLALFLALAACSKDDMQGEIVNKDVEPGYDWLYMQPIYSTRCSGKPVVCTQYQSGTIPIWYHIPTCYEIKVEGETSGSTCLDEDEWNDLSVGDQYIGPDVDPKDRKTKKD